MRWEREFISQNYGVSVYKYADMDLYETDTFDFFRCVEFNPDFYGKTASTLFNGNLRMCSTGNRYAKLFPNKRLSYWADSVKTARAEIKKHGAGNSILTFWAYDDASSTFPISSNQEPLRIIDGRKCGVQELIDKADNDVPLSEAEQEYMKRLLEHNPDCLVYDSHAQEGGENYIFFDRGFKKLALRELSLRLSRAAGGNHNKIVCAGTSDYTPYIKNYGMYFAEKARVEEEKSYLSSEEYLQREACRKKSLEWVKDQI